MTEKATTGVLAVAVAQLALLAGVCCEYADAAVPNHWFLYIWAQVRKFPLLAIGHGVGFGGSARKSIGNCPRTKNKGKSDPSVLARLRPRRWN